MPRGRRRAGAGIISRTEPEAIPGLVLVASHGRVQFTWRKRRSRFTLAALDSPQDVRIDKWLWAARVFKTRALALAACRAGHVKFAGHPVKPRRTVRIGDEYVITTGGPTRTIRVTGITDRRVGPKLVSSLLIELTPPEEFARARRSLVEQVLARPKGSGRPTKRERRRLERFLP